ncbi:helix-turn-helix domain-containing protein [Endozoicomonas sp. Mp262]|uniref:helix-turn-helix domain-containing protein n=1 Tax=Endozoicomonas sp. Mp262 TaxID=2919499 RepID=UPI0021D8E306
MTTLTDVQIIHHSGKPAFAVVPYDMWLSMTKGTSSEEKEQVYFPHEVIGFQLKGDSLIAAWRKFRKLTQLDLADKLGISQSAMAQMEKTDSRPQEKTLDKLAQALGIHIDQLRETDHLTASPKNAKRLNDAIAEIDDCKTQQHGLIDE